MVLTRKWSKSFLHDDAEQIQKFEITGILLNLFNLMQNEHFFKWSVINLTKEAVFNEKFLL